MRTRLHRPRMQMRITRQISAALATHPAQGVNQYLQPDILLIIDCKNYKPNIRTVTIKIMRSLLPSTIRRYDKTFHGDFRKISITLNG